MKKIYTLVAIAVFSTSFYAQTNLIPNSGFENWTGTAPDSWFIPTTATTAIAKSTDVKYAGTSSISIVAPTTGNRTISPTTDIPVTQGVTYVFSGWYLDNSATAKFKCWNQFRTIPGSTGGADTGANPLQSPEFSTDSASWQFFTGESVPNTKTSSGNTTNLDATAARAGLRVYPESPTATGGIIYFDDIMFYDKSTLSVKDVKDFDNQVKMNSVVSNVLRIQMPTRATVNIYSTDGKLYSSNRVNSDEAINTQSLAKGVYLVTIQNDYAKTSRKFVKN
jgi:hypothetical protein